MGKDFYTFLYSFNYLQLNYKNSIFLLTISHMEVVIYSHDS